MAEGYLRKFGKGRFNIYSAGVETHGVNPRAIKAMAEDDIDISGHTSNHVDEYADIDFSYIITVCDHAQERCPVFPSTAQQFHYNFPDPAKARGSEEQIMDSFYHTRDLIKQYCADFMKDH
jgi:arsenate reductase